MSGCQHCIQTSCPALHSSCSPAVGTPQHPTLCHKLPFLFKPSPRQERPNAVICRLMSPEKDFKCMLCV